MSNVVPINPIAHARAVKARLWNPAGARQSSELEVVPAPAFRKQQDRRQVIVEWQKAKLDAETGIAIDNAIRSSRAANHLLNVPRDRERATAIARRLQEEEAIETPSLAAILRHVATYYGVPKIDILSHRRAARVVIPRQIVMYLGRELTLHSTCAIGRFLKRDHTTIIHGHRRIASLMAKHIRIAADIDNIKWNLGGRS